MNSEFIKYLKPLLIATLLSAVCLLFMQLIVYKDAAKLAVFWVIPVFYFLIYAAFHYGILMNVDNGQAFIRYYMAATVIKLFVLLAVIISFSFYYKEAATAFTINFMLAYLFFMGFEVIYLRKHLGASRK